MGDVGAFGPPGRHGAYVRFYQHQSIVSYSLLFSLIINGPHNSSSSLILFRQLQCQYCALSVSSFVFIKHLHFNRRKLLSESRVDIDFFSSNFLQKGQAGQRGVKGAMGKPGFKVHLHFRLVFLSGEIYQKKGKIKVKLLLPKLKGPLKKKCMIKYQYTNQFCGAGGF